MSAPWSLPAKAALVVSLCGDALLSDAQFRVAITLILGFHNTKTGDCYPSYRQLAKASNTSESTAKRATERLRTMGVLAFEKNNGGRNKRNHYSLKERVSLLDGLRTETVSLVH